MLTSDFDYDLPPELIAQEPAAQREAARLMVLDRAGGDVAHRGIAELPSLLRPGDLVVVNDTRVLAARLFGRRVTGGRVEVLLVRPAPASGADAWEAMVRCGGSLQPGERIAVGDGAVALIEPLGGGRWSVVAEGEGLPSLMARAGKLPLPPYIRREEIDARDALDRERYQTVYARDPGAIAAPTAGLHLSVDLLDRLADHGVRRAAVTLHVGIGTFAPVRVDDLDDHEMHEEHFTIPEGTVRAIHETRAAGGRVVAVGTTTVRALESAAAGAGELACGAASTALFIRPGFRFQVVDALLTNFHLPRSTLLCLVSALAGRDAIFAAYAEAVRERYRFFSYGDAMLIA